MIREYNDASPVMIEIALERLIERGEVVLLDNPTYEQKLHIMEKVNEEIYKDAPFALLCNKEV